MAFLDATWLGNSWLQYLEFFGIVLAGIVLGKIFYWVSKNIVKRLTKKTKTQLDDLLVEALQRPAIFFLFTLGFRIGSEFLTLNEQAAKIFTSISEMLFTIAIGWFIMNIIDSLILNYLKPAAAKSKSDLDDALIPIIRKGIRMVIITIMFVMIIDNFGYDVTTLIAGLGLGGLAFALAAQDLVSNLFGGLAILSDKPFKIGDYIVINDREKGFVKEIGLRTTRIETFDKTIIVIPNSEIAHKALENISEEPARKVKITLGLTYETSSAKIKKARKIIKDIIKKNKDTQNECSITFINFGDSALEFLVMYWIKNKKAILDAKDSVNTAIKKEFDKEKIDFAYPTQTVYVKK